MKDIKEVLAEELDSLFIKSGAKDSDFDIIISIIHLTIEPKTKAFWSSLGINSLTKQHTVCIDVGKSRSEVELCDDDFTCASRMCKSTASEIFRCIKILAANA